MEQEDFCFGARKSNILVIVPYFTEEDLPGREAEALEKTEVSQTDGFSSAKSHSYIYIIH